MSESDALSNETLWSGIENDMYHEKEVQDSFLVAAP